MMISDSERYCPSDMKGTKEGVGWEHGSVKGEEERKEAE